MNFIFFGSPNFAAIILAKLINAGFVPAAIICNPDRPVGRKKIVTPPPVKQRIMNYELRIKDRIKILQPEQLDQNFLNSLFVILNSKFDFAIVAAYAKIIPKEIIDFFPHGVIGVHPSLLPKYRGATPIQSAILAGEEKTGVTLYLLDEKMDHGQILAKRALGYPISDIRYPILFKELAELGGDLLVEILPKLVAGKIKPEPQDESLATYTKKFTADDAFLPPEILRFAQNDGGNAAIKAERMIRALNPEPGVWTTKNGKRLKLLEAELDEGKLSLKKTQVAGEKPKSAD